MAAQMRTKTVYTHPVLEELQRVGGKSFAKRSTLIMRVLILLMAAANTAGGVYLIGLGASTGSSVVGFVFCVMALGFVAWFFLFYALRAWTVSRVMGDLTSEYVLEEEGLRIWNWGEESFCPYETVTGLMEGELSFYVEQVKGGTLVLEKANVKNGSPDRLRALLEEKCKTKTRWMGK